MEFGGRMWGLLWVVVLVLVLVNGCYGYSREEERVALLQLKASINHPNGTFLPSWVEGTTESVEYCEWEGIECNNSTGRLIQLSLNWTRDLALEDYWYLNASLFLPFQELKILYLRGNSLAGWFENEGSEKLSSSLSNLEVLDLSDNHLNNSILSSLGGFSSLRFLSLSRNNLKGLIRLEDLDALTNLEELHLNQNMIESFATPKGSKRLSSSFSNLEVLDLSYNHLNNSILSSLGGFSSLKFLSLYANNLKGLIRIEELNDCISLKELDLSGNEIKGFNPIQGNFERMLSSLEILHLDANELNNSTLSSLGGLKSLKFLSLAENRLKGLIRIEDLDALTNLEQLDLSDNKIESFVTPKGFKSFSKLRTLSLDSNKVNTSILQQSLGAFSSLKTLSLQYNTLNGTINSQDLHDLSNLEELVLDGSSLNKNFLQSIGLMTSLKILSLTDCGLNGTLPPQGWCELKSLQELYLLGNGFQESLPSCLGNLTSLRVLDLSDNQFTGNIALSPLSNLTSLEFISLSNNNFQVPISFSSFANHSNLEVIFSDSNKLVADSEFQTRVPKFQLKVFSLSNCTHIDLELNGAPPNFLFYQNDLRVVDLSHNNFRGKFPGWLLQNNTKLEGLYLRNNSFVGPLQLPSHPNPNILQIDISKNKVGGQIPINFSWIFPNLSTLNMSRNLFEGSIPSSFGDMKSLISLDLSNNNLTGGIPEHLAMGCSSLWTLMLSNNNLDGQMFPKHVNLPELQYLYLNGNNFVGEIPDSLSNNNNRMSILDISNNHLSGKLPIWIGNMSNLELIDLSRNHLEGPIPLEFCKLDRLKFMDLSKNNLSGFIPSCFNPFAITHVHLNNNKLRGPMTHAFYNSSSLVTLDLSENNLNGSIPNWIGTLSALSILLLKANHFEGEIPIQICHLMKLSVMDLSRNNLSGTIPPCLSNITFEATEKKSHVSSDHMMGNAFLDTPSLENIWQTGFLGEKELEINYIRYDHQMYDVEEQMEFTTKRMTYSYKGRVLELMSGIDLSCNQLTGEIPLEIGNLGTIRMLNLSHNNLSGSIPATFSNLRQTESLDLSYNLLNGTIPLQLTELNSLAVFSVAHNNLEGATPDRKAQFLTFEESSYEGNPLLCGPPLSRSCSGTGSPPPVPNGEEEDSSFIDMNVFYVSFIVSYVIVLLGIAVVLYINPYWRRTWFRFIEVGMASCYYFVLDNFLMYLPNLRHHV